MGDTRKNLVVFSGAGMSAESGIKTFRDSDGLWEEYDIMDVATPKAWARQPKVVLAFYNARLKQVIDAKPNKGHLLVSKLEEYHNVTTITQNIDDLHERAGSKNVLHLHGEITKARSSINSDLLYPIRGNEIKWGELCELGSQLRPHVVWFGEEVPAMWEAERIVNRADILIVIGTSLNVYPAASIVQMAPSNCKIIVIDPGEPLIPSYLNVRWIKRKAGEGMSEIFPELIG